MTTVKALKDWLNTLDENHNVAIDDDGMRLCEVVNGKEGDWLEIGGFKPLTQCVHCGAWINPSLGSVRPI